MALTIQATEPDSVTSGDTLKFYSSVSLTDYPIATWTLLYTLVGSGGSVAGTTSTDSGSFLITFAMADTALIAAGDYRLFATLTDGTERVTVFDQSIKVIKNLEGAPASDTRSDAKVALDSIEAVIFGRATKDQESYTINGRSLSRTPVESLYKLRDRLKAQVVSEERAERVARGLGHSGNIRVRFT